VVTPDHQIDATTANLSVNTGETVRTQTGQWAKRTGSATTVSAATDFSGTGWTEILSLKSDKGLQFAMKLSDDFYVIKPTSVALPKLIYANVANQLFDDRAKILGWMESHAGNAEAITRYQALLDNIDAKLLKMGLAETVDGKTVPRSQFDQLFLQLPTITASGGGVFIKATIDPGLSIGKALESGRIKAHGSALINITNNTPFGLIVNDVAILDSSRQDIVDGKLTSLEPGTVYWNGKPLGMGGLAGEAGASGTSQIKIMQDAYPKEYYDLGVTIPDAPQDLYVRGKIDNADGDLYLTNLEGSINVTGEIRAKEIKLTASGDFNLSTDDWYHTNEDPRQYVNFDKIFGQTLYNDAGSPRSANLMAGDPTLLSLEQAIFGVVPGSRDEAESNDTLALAETLSNGGEIKAHLGTSADVDYYKVKVGAPGKIDLALTIPGGSFSVQLLDANKNLLGDYSVSASQTLAMNVASSGTYFVRVTALSSSTYNAGQYRVLASFEEDRKSILFAMGAIDINARYLNIDGLVQSGVDNIELHIAKDFAPTESVNFTDSAGNVRPGISFAADGLITVDGAFDAKNKVILLDPIKPTGGKINLTGTIVSTGNGELRVASGYASVHIDNESVFDLAVDTIDVSENRIGTITITDSTTLLREEFTVQNGQFTRVMKQGVLVAKTEGETAVSSINYVEVPGSLRTGINAVMNSAGYAPIYYQPAPGRYYTWVEGQAMTQTEVYTYEQKSFNLLGFDWDGLVPDEAAKDVQKQFEDGTPLLESEEVTLENSDAVLMVGYLRMSNPAVDMVKDTSLVRDVKTNKLYQYVGEASTVSFPVTDFTDSTKWKFLENLSGGRLNNGVWENTELNPVLRSDGSKWVAKKADYHLDSTFANQEITVKGPTTTGGGWLREKVITTITTVVTGLKDFYGYSLKADLPVAISSLTGSDKPVVDIKTTGTLRLRSSISVGDSPIDEDAEDFRPLALSANALEVSGTALFSGALPEIKANSDVIIKVKDPNGKLNIQATGQIRVEQLEGKTNTPIKIGQVVAASYSRDGELLGAGEDTTGAELSAAYDVQIVSLNGILGTNNLSRIVGATVQLDGGTGLVMARVDSAPLGVGGLAVRASGSINVEETAGDMRLVTPTAWSGDVSVSTTGDVTLQASAGAIIDASFERYTPDGSVAAANMAKGGFTNAESGHYALAPDLIAFLLPHMETYGQGGASGAEKL
ncbi:MAG: PPC domain-containing protein, partial [Magnetococcales bacterium]|nr:PPC domain-containing protein [Magnetococcales bacterium]